MNKITIESLRTLRAATNAAYESERAARAEILRCETVDARYGRSTSPQRREAYRVHALALDALDVAREDYRQARAGASSDVAASHALEVKSDLLARRVARGEDPEDVREDLGLPPGR